MSDFSAEAELALLLTGTFAARERAHARIVELAELVDEDAFVAFLHDQRMVLLGSSRLVEHAPHAASERFRDHLKKARATAGAAGMVFGAVSRHLTDALEHDGIQAVELKGAALAEELYGDAAMRAYADIDVLVPVARLDDAVAVACRLGWTEPAMADRRPTLHRWLDHPADALPVLEIHWRVHWYETRFAEAMLARSRVLEGGRRLEPLDGLAGLLLFYARDGFNGLRLAADIGAWWDRYGDAATPRRLGELTAEHPELAEAWRASLAAVAPLAGLPSSAVPPALRPRGRRATLACRLRNWDLRGDIDQIKANVSLVDALLSPSGQLRPFVHRHLLPSAVDLSKAYGVSPNSRFRLAGSRVGHAAKMSGRYGLALAQLRGGRSWSPLPPEREVALMYGASERVGVV